ncbi:hypothetical protein DH2020_010644 [Rehmannia glutinosa]|uniref:RING-type domain-containing protein n=1 Tax=Rehmannia glutinosa TaxID=99300 RepID=A0ABR0XBA0_REHGL
MYNGGGRPRYEYRYRFSRNDDRIISDDMIFSNWTTLSQGLNVFLFETRTNFILKRIIVHDDHDDDETIIMGFESYDIKFYEREEELCLEFMMGYRLDEYWMPDDEIQNLVHGALDFAKQQLICGVDDKSSIGRVIPLVVGVDVCTVQQEGEELDAAMDRAIRPEKLIPLSVWYHINYVEKHNHIDLVELVEFMLTLLRIRVEDVDKGLSLMETCPICLHNPTIGTQITFLPLCGHAFHNHCIIRWLQKNNSCPFCRVRAYDHFLHP